MQTPNKKLLLSLAWKVTVIIELQLEKFNTYAANP